jgi:hypothetical protein
VVNLEKKGFETHPAATRTKTSFVSIHIGRIRGFQKFLQKLSGFGLSPTALHPLSFFEEQDRNPVGTLSKY